MIWCMGVFFAILIAGVVAIELVDHVAKGGADKDQRRLIEYCLAELALTLCISVVFW